MSGIFIAVTKDGDSLDATVEHMNRVTQDWTLRAARGECGWICADCCVSFPAGMPDACEHGHQACTDIIQRDKREAIAKATGGEA
jgi:hypothetical protein